MSAYIQFWAFYYTERKRRDESKESKSPNTKQAKQIRATVKTRQEHELAHLPEINFFNLENLSLLFFHSFKIFCILNSLWLSAEKAKISRFLNATTPPSPQQSPIPDSSGRRARVWKVWKEQQQRGSQMLLQVFAVTTPRMEKKAHSTLARDFYSSY